MKSVASSTSMKPVMASSLCKQRPVFGSLPSLGTQQRTACNTSRRIPTSPVQNTEVSRPATRVVRAHAVQEVYQVADVAGFVGGTAATMFAMTLVGLAIGFVLLRFEALVEEGKI